MEKDEAKDSAGTPGSAENTTHIAAWKIILVVSILLALMIIGGFVMKS